MYNLSPFMNILKEDVVNADTWKERISTFFNSDEYDPVLQDWYYDKLISNMKEVESLLRGGAFTDEYTGLFSLPSDKVEATHSFNIALFLSNHCQHFFRKRILTITGDFGVMNVQAKLCGLDIVSSIQRDELHTGTVLTCIGNNAPPYPINKFDVNPDVVILSCVFQEEAVSYRNWEFMIDSKLDGKEVFFTSNTYKYLRQYMNYEQIELVIDPKKLYNSDDYADISYGYMNRIYRLK